MLEWRKSKKCLSLFYPVYDIQFANLRVDGDIFNWNYDAYNESGDLIVTVRKKMLSFVDIYVMDIIDEDYEMVMLAFTTFFLAVIFFAGAFFDIAIVTSK